jgi:hypothetical protein
MHVKKNLMLWAAALALALPMLFVGTASAFYAPDGSKMVPAGGWDITDKGVCVTGVTSTGLIITNTATSRPDCIATQFSNDASLQSGPTCTGDSDANGGSHFWASTCVGADGTFISLKDLDRTATNCTQRATALSNGPGTWTNKCTGSWIYTGPAGDGAPGFAYTKVRVTAAYADSASCLANGSTIGYAWSTANGGTCTYAYGIKGIADGKITNKIGGTYAAAGASVDLSTMTQGQAIWNGVSFSTGVAKGGTASLDGGNIVIATPLTLGGRAGCLECHNSMSQNNGYAERWKESYLKTGHKNMLRKVTAGTNLVGPDGAVYTTTDLLHNTDSIDFAAGMYTAATGSTSGVATQLFYIYGDWMAAAPSVVYNNSLTDALASNGYSCAACHTTGFANSSAGVCSQSSKATAAACTGTNPLTGLPNVWTASVGIEGIQGAEPQASYPGIKSITGTWQKDGITCARCHNTTFPAVTVAGNPNETTGGHNNEALIIGKNVTGICYGCHQSPAKTANGGLDIDTNHPEYIPVKNTSTVISSSNPNGYAPEWNGHVLGNSFLNSPHGKYTGAIAPNKLGKYNISGGTYASTFKGKYCRTGTVVGAGSIMKTYVNATNGAAEVIKSKADCTTAGGFWGDAGTAADGYQGSCTTCHDVHQSVVPEVGAAEPFVRECTTCHVDPTNAQEFTDVPTQITTIHHLTGVGTPLENAATDPASSCEICHMAKATSGGFPQHLWRINTDAAYSSFPTKAAFYGGLCSVNTGTAPFSSAGCTANGGTWTAVTKDLNGQIAADGSYANAVWVDLNSACGQCHGGSSSVTANGARYLSLGELATFAYNMHDTKADARPVAKFSWATDPTTDYNVLFDASGSTCTGTCTYSWVFGDGGSGTDSIRSHVYGDATTRTATVTVANGSGSDSYSLPVIPKFVGSNKVVVTSAIPTQDGSTATVVVVSSGGTGTITSKISWGDGATETKTGHNQTFGPHTYSSMTTYKGSVNVTDSGVNGQYKTSDTEPFTVTFAPMTISGLVTKVSGSNLSGVSLTLKQGGVAKRLSTSATTGRYTFSSVAPGDYSITATKAGYTFNIPAVLSVSTTTTSADIQAIP